MFTIVRNKSLVNFTGSNVLRLQKPNHASHLTVGRIWYQRVHCLNLSHSQRGKVCCTNCTRQLFTLYWTHHMTHQLQWNNCAGCMRKRSLLSRCPTYIPKYTVSYPKTLTLLSNMGLSHISEMLGTAIWPQSSQYLCISQKQKVTASFKEVISYWRRKVHQTCTDA